jgi:predicted nucleic acid-binding protein
MLRAFFPSAPLVLDAAQHLRLLDRLAEAGIAGGRIYDALIGVTASEHGHELISLDARAATTYRHLGVRARRPG